MTYVLEIPSYKRNINRMSHDRLLRPRMVAELLGVSRSTVYRWFWEGSLKGVKMGSGTLRILESSVNEKLQFAY